MQYATEGEGLKYKAFTLIELLAVIIIIGIIALIVSPIILGTIKRSERATFERSIDGLIESVRIDHSDDDFVAPREYYYEKRNLTLLTVNDKTRDEDIRINGKIDGSGFIYVDDDGNIYIENICSKKYCANGPDDDIKITENPTGEIPNNSKTDPMIKLNGASTIYVEINGEYKELGATARTKVGTPLTYVTSYKKNNITVSGIDTKTEGEYIVTYSATNEGKTVSVERKVVVAEMTPVITMTEPSTKYVKLQNVLVNVSAIKPNTITSFEYELKKDGIIERQQTVSGLSRIITLDSTGIYEVIVTVEDDNGHKASLSKTYKVDTIPPVITFDDVRMKLDKVQEYDINNDSSVTVTDNSGIVTYTNSGMFSSTAGTHEVTYTATDEAGNVTTKVRKFIIEKADVPVLALTPMSTSTWVLPLSVTATVSPQGNDNITSFMYSLNGGAETTIVDKGTINLNTTGEYKIVLKAVGSYSGETSITSGTYKIDATKPTVEGVTVANPTTVTASKKITATLKDSNSGVRYYAVTTSNTAPTQNSTVWKSVGNSAVGSYTVNYTATVAGTYYIWAKDNVGNISENKAGTSGTVSSSYLDTTIPSLAVNNYSGKVGDNKALSSLYTVTYGKMGGSTTCSYNGTTIVNVNYFTVPGTYTVSCSARGNNGKSSGNKSMSITLVKPDMTGEELVKDNPDVRTEDPDGNPRFVGANPNNYVRFGNEMYRIIGVFNGQMKLIYWGPMTEVGKVYSDRVLFDQDTSHGDYGYNSWVAAQLKTTLNSTYWNSIISEYQSMVDARHVWDIKGKSSYGTRSSFYNSERKGTVGSMPNNPIWTGAVGLMYPSDYAYATDGENCDGNWSAVEKTLDSSCYSKTNNWLANDTYNRQLTMTPNTTDGTYVFVVEQGGLLNSVRANTRATSSSQTRWGSARPVIFLHPGVKIISGTGTVDDPYELEYKPVPAESFAITNGLTSVGGAYRYQGGQPANYVSFNGTLFRIIGVFNGQMKIIQNDFYSTGIAWNSNNTNNWSVASLQNELNTTYWNTISSEYQTFVDRNYIWTTGGLIGNSDDFRRMNIYMSERGTAVYSGRPKTWTGAVGLMYPSDYGYATSAFKCDSSMLQWSSAYPDNNECYSTTYNWLANTSYNQWTITPISNKTNELVYISSSGIASTYRAQNALGARPVLYLKSDVKIKSGAGTTSNPYILTQ